MYTIEYSKQAKKSLEKFPKKTQLTILEKIEILAIDPRPIGAIAMKGNYKGFHRIRVGDYRVIYHIQDKKLLILILKIAQRGCVYEN